MRLNGLRLTILMVYNSRLNAAEKSVMICVAACGSDFTAKRLDINVISESLSMPMSIIEKVMMDLERLGYIVCTNVEKRGKTYRHYSITEKIRIEYDAVNELSKKRRIKKSESIITNKIFGYREDD
jgi:predicted transcriptional regulator